MRMTPMRSVTGFYTRNQRVLTDEEPMAKGVAVNAGIGWCQAGCNIVAIQSGGIRWDKSNPSYSSFAN